MNIKKAKKEALEYFESSLRFSYHDCSDSRENMDRSKARFDAFVDDSIKIKDFLQEKCLDECAKIYQEFYDADLKHSEWINNRDDLENPSVMNLSIPFKLIESKLKLAERHLK